MENNNNCNCNNPAPLEFIRHPSVDDGGGGGNDRDCLTDVTDDDDLNGESPDIDDPDDPTLLVLATPRRSVWPESIVNKPLKRTEYIIC